MDDFNWGYFVLGLIACQIIKMFALTINQAIIERRQKQMLKLVQVIFPDNEKISFITVDATDKRAMAKIEREVRSHYDVGEEDVNDTILPQRPKPDSLSPMKRQT